MSQDFADVSYEEPGHVDGHRSSCPGCVAGDMLKLETVAAARAQLMSHSIDVASSDRLARLALRVLGVKASEWPIVHRSPAQVDRLNPEQKKLVKRWRKIDQRDAVLLGAIKALRNIERRGLLGSAESGVAESIEAAIVARDLGGVLDLRHDEVLWAWVGAAPHDVWSSAVRVLLSEVRARQGSATIDAPGETDRPRVGVCDVAPDRTLGVLSVGDRRLLEVEAAKYADLGTVGGFRLGAALLDALSAVGEGRRVLDSSLGEIESWVVYSSVPRVRLAGCSLLSAIYVDAVRSAALACRDQEAGRSADALDSLISSYVSGVELSLRDRDSCESGSFGCDMFIEVMLARVLSRPCREQEEQAGSAMDATARSADLDKRRSVFEGQLPELADRTRAEADDSDLHADSSSSDLRVCASSAGGFLLDFTDGYGDASTAIKAGILALSGDRDAMESYARHRSRLESVVRHDGDYLDGDAKRAVVVMMEQVDDEIRVAEGRPRIHHHRVDDCLVHLSAIEESCRDAVNRSGSSPPRVMISADVLSAVVHHLRCLSSGLTCLNLRTDGEVDGWFRGKGRMGELIAVASRGPIVGGPGAADACGDVAKFVSSDARRHVDGY